MIDWPGLLKWSLNYNDNLKPTEIPMLTEEQRQFLEEAFQAACFQEVHRMKDIIKELEESVASENNTDLCIELLDELIEVLASLDMSKNFCKIGGPFFMIKYAMDTKIDDEVRGLALIVVSDVAANNHYAHPFFCNVKFYEIAEIVADNNSSPVLKGRAISALNAIIKGNNLVTKRLFVNKGGYKLLAALLNDPPQPHYIKLFRLLSELYRYDKFMHKNIEIVDDPNIDVKNIEDCPDYAHLKGFFLNQSNEFSQMFLNQAKHIFSEDSVKNTALRSSFADCLNVYYENLRRAKIVDYNLVKDTKVIVDQHIKKIEKGVKKDDVYESEIHNLRRLQKILDI